MASSAGAAAPDDGFWVRRDLFIVQVATRVQRVQPPAPPRYHCVQAADTRWRVHRNGTDGTMGQGGPGPVQRPGRPVWTSSTLFPSEVSVSKGGDQFLADRGGPPPRPFSEDDVLSPMIEAT